MGNFVTTAELLTRPKDATLQEILALQAAERRIDFCVDRQMGRECLHHLNVLVPVKTEDVELAEVA